MSLLLCQKAHESPAKTLYVLYREMYLLIGRIALSAIFIAAFVATFGLAPFAAKKL